mgnify:CR=1 FL=1
MRSVGAKPGSGDMAGRHGRGGYAVVSCWKVDGGDSDPRIEEAGASVRLAAALPPGSCTAAASSRAAWFPSLVAGA